MGCPTEVEVFAAQAFGCADCATVDGVAPFPLGDESEEDDNDGAVPQAVYGPETLADFALREYGPMYAATLTGSGIMPTPPQPSVGGPGGIAPPDRSRPKKGDTLGHARMVRKWFELCYLQFGRCLDTPAERRIMFRWMAEEMKAQTVRVKDAMAWIPLVVEMMFVPTVDEIYASMVARSGTAVALKAMLSQERS